MTGAVTTKYENQHPVKVQTSSFSYKFYWKPLLWTRAYCLISTGGATIGVIEKYIQSQRLDKK